MELREYLAILRRRLVTLLIPLIVALLGVTALAAAVTVFNFAPVDLQRRIDLGRDAHARYLCQ